MTIEIAIVLGIIALAFILFITEALPIDVIAVSILALLLLLGFLTPQEAIIGFSNPAVITIGLLFILSMAIEKTHILEFLVIRLNQLFSKNVHLGLFIFLITVALSSAFINNTAIVAIFIPITVRVAKSYQISPSKLLIPLSYAAILGGTLTLVGTSTNLLVNSIVMQDPTQSPLGMFEFAKYSIIQLVIGITYLMFFARQLLPSRTVTSSLTRSFHMGAFLTEMKLLPDSRLIGRTVLERNLNQNYDVTVLEILREGRHISSNIRNMVLQADDILFVRGTVENFLRMKEVERIAMLTDQKLTGAELTHEDNILVEAVLTDKSNFIGRTLMEINFRRRFGSFVLAIRKEGAILRRKVAHVILSAYDTLLVYGPREKINSMAGNDDFIVVGEYELGLRKHRLWWLSLVLITLAITLAALGIVPILKGALIAVAILWGFRVVTPNESYRAIRWQVLILIGALIPLGIVIQSSGTAAWFSQILIGVTRSIPPEMAPYVLLSLVYLMTIVLTEISSNATAAIIMAPIVHSLATQLGLDFRPFIFAVCFAASASFVTPVGYQTNLMVYGPGGYKFSDYIKVGLPLALMFWLLASLLIPQIWPFYPV